MYLDERFVIGLSGSKTRRGRLGIRGERYTPSPLPIDPPLRLGSISSVISRRRVPILHSIIAVLYICIIINNTVLYVAILTPKRRSFETLASSIVRCFKLTNERFG